jgi:Lrp/AsnC family leucine-responsive transcriptional regulator
MDNHLDKIDKAILNLIQDNSKITVKEIASKLHKSMNPIYDRVKALEASGIIKQYTAIIDKNKLGNHLIAFTNVQLKEHAEEMIKKFEQNIQKLEEVMECYHMTGHYDYLLKVIVEDMSQYQDFIVNKLAKIENIGTVQSNFMMTEVKYKTNLLLK